MNHPHIVIIESISKRVRSEHRHDWQGTEICPICEGVLHLEYSARSGHTAGSCETENCLKWME
jgi:hypothetical protein